MTLSRSLCIAIVLNVLLGLSSSLVEAACCVHRSTGDSAPVEPLNEESEDAFESDLEFDDLALCGIEESSTDTHGCRSEILSERRLLVWSTVTRTSLAPRAPPAC